MACRVAHLCEAIAATRAPFGRDGSKYGVHMRSDGLNENDKLEILVRSLTQQNMDIAHELQREREERERTHQAHAELMLELGKLRERQDRGESDVA